MTRAIVVGAGIGGLAAALSLHRSGVDVEVYEQADRVRELGTGINVLPPAIAVLADLGLLDVLLVAGIETFELRMAGLVAATEEILEDPPCDRDPLEVWSYRRVTLLGDAGHPMYPMGSNGATQAIIDGDVLAACLADADGDVAGALVR